MHNNISLNSTGADSNFSMLQEKLSYVESLRNDLKYLLANYESTLEHEGIRQHVETLERWMEDYRSGLFAANRLSENGTTLLLETRDRLKLTAEELLRLESEGGNTANKNQMLETEKLVKSNEYICEVLSNFEQLFNENRRNSNNDE